MVEQIDRMDAIFHALAHEVRREMLRRLAQGELTLGELAAPVSMSFEAASKHVKVLERAGLVRRTIVGRRHVVRLEPGPLAAASAWLQCYERFWTELLEFIPDQRLVFRWGLIGPERRAGPSFDTHLTVTLREDPSGATRLDLVHEGLEELAAAMPHIADNVGPGWEAVLTKLEGVLAAEGQASPAPDSNGGTLAMNQREVLDVFDDPVAQDLLQSPILARLAYIAIDGTPRVIPIGYLWNGREIVVCTAPTSPKVRALRANNQVALTVDTDQQPSQQLLIRGTASLEIVEGVPPEYLKASEKVLPEEQWEQFAENVRAMYKQMARITIVPAWARVFDFGTGRLPAFLQRLAEERSAVVGGSK